MTTIIIDRAVVKQALKMLETVRRDDNLILAGYKSARNVYELDDFIHVLEDVLIEQQKTQE